MWQTSVDYLPHHIDIYLFCFVLFFEAFRHLLSGQLHCFGHFWQQFYSGPRWVVNSCSLVLDKLIHKGDLNIGTFPRPCYCYILCLFISTKKWSGACYQHSVPIMRYVWIHFVPIVNQTRDLFFPTVPITRPHDMVWRTLFILHNSVPVVDQSSKTKEKTFRNTFFALSSNETFLKLFNPKFT